MSSIKRLTMSITRLYSPYRMPSSTKFLEHQTLAMTTVLGNRYLSNNARLLQKHNTYRRNFSIYNSVQPGAPLPSPPPSSSSWRWILGIVFTVVLPVVTNKWGPLSQFKNEVDTAVETIEEIVEVVEKVAEVVDEVAESISDNIPTGGKLKRVVELVEGVAEETAKDAHTVGDVIDKFQKVEDNVEDIVETLSGRHEAHMSTPNKPVKDEK
ncbi:hypothetical protein ACJIZ3_002863 [Penstemon smallii]|uniref:Uncharacterized protein n=1 Tax=Penstemon smallii TaxID=265156 RepID=A0ABD3U8Z7_9LAMI